MAVIVLFMFAVAAVSGLRQPPIPGCTVKNLHGCIPRSLDYDKRVAFVATLNVTATCPGPNGKTIEVVDFFNQFMEIGGGKKELEALNPPVCDNHYFDGHLYYINPVYYCMTSSLILFNNAIRQKNTPKAVFFIISDFQSSDLGRSTYTTFEYALWDLYLNDKINWWTKRPYYEVLKHMWKIIPLCNTETPDEFNSRMENAICQNHVFTCMKKKAPSIFSIPTPKPTMDPDMMEWADGPTHIMGDADMYTSLTKMESEMSETHNVHNSFDMYSKVIVNTPMKGYVTVLGHNPNMMDGYMTDRPNINPNMMNGYMTDGPNINPNMMNGYMTDRPNPNLPGSNSGMYNRFNAGVFGINNVQTTKRTETDKEKDDDKSDLFVKIGVPVGVVLLLMGIGVGVACFLCKRAGNTTPMPRPVQYPIAGTPEGERLIRSDAELLNHMNTVIQTSCNSEMTLDQIKLMLANRGHMQC